MKGGCSFGFCFHADLNDATRSLDHYRLTQVLITIFLVMHQVLLVSIWANNYKYSTTTGSCQVIGQQKNPKKFDNRATLCYTGVINQRGSEAMKNLIANIKWSITCFVIDCQTDFRESRRKARRK